MTKPEQAPHNQHLAEQGMDANCVVDVQDLRVYFPLEDTTVKAVDGISFHINKGETVAVVGESGSGKSVSAMAMMRLNDASGGKMPTGSINLRLPDDSVVDLSLIHI